MSRFWLALTSCILLGTLIAMRPVPALAQPPARGGLANFERSGPDIGQRLPDVQAFREDGKPISLSSLRGKYTVLVFGCLT